MVLMNRVLINLGPIKIYYYSVIMMLSVLTGILLAFKESKHYNMKDYIVDLVTYLIIFGIIGARFYYVIFNFDIYKHNILDIFKIWEGGIAIYGGIIGGICAIIYYANKRKESIIRTMDIIAPGLILAQSIGRWGNFFNSEAHGVEVSLTYLKNLHIPNFIIEGMNIGGTYYHPTFLYESLWCLIGFAILVSIRKITKRKLGIITSCYFVWYGIGRYMIEGLRTDSLYLGNFRISQLVSIFFIIFGICLIFIMDYKERRKNEK